MTKKDKAIYLRKNEGRSYNEICEKTGIAKSTLSYWLKDVPISKRYQKRLNNRNPAKNASHKSHIKSGETWRNKNKDIRKSYQLEGRKEAKGFNLHLTGCMLYWAEGSKCRNSIKFTNTDLSMVEIFIDFLSKCYGITKSDMKIRCQSHVLSEFSLTEVEEYWIKQLGLTKNNLSKGTTEQRIPKKKSVKYPYGICTVIVNNTKILQQIYGSIKEYAGICNEEAWIF